MENIIKENKVVKNEVDKDTAKVDRKRNQKKEISPGDLAPVGSIQSQFVQAHKDNEDLGKKSYEKHSLLYRWNGNAWGRLQESTAQEIAWKWLNEKNKAVADDKYAKSCVACLKYEVREVPDEPKDTIIPLNNAWLRINTEKNRIEVMAPNRDYFVDYSLNITLPDSDRSKYIHTFTVNDEYIDHRTNPHLFLEEAGVELYLPKPLPEGSLFKQFIETSMPNPEIRGLLQEYCGYTLMKANPFQVAQVWEGNGSNGKSVLIAIMEALHKNSRSVDLDNLTPNELHKLIGASLVVSPETPKKAINEQVLKKCITGDSLSVRALYENSIDYKPTAKWIISCNTFPILQDDTNGIWRRLQIFRWEKEFQGKEIIRDLEKKIIETELRTVLDWCLIGLLRLLEREGFDTAPIDDLKEEKKIASDNVLQFIKHVGLAVNKSQEVYSKPKGDIYADYRDYCEINGFSPSSSEKFWKKVKNNLKGMDEQRRRVAEERVIFVNLFYQW